MRSVSSALRPAVWITLLLSISTALRAQVSSGSIAGQVADQSRAAIANVTVRLTNQGTAVERSVQSDNAGDYLFQVVPPGIYRIRVEAAGFRAMEVSGLEVQVAQQVKRDFELQVGDTSTKLEVTASSPVLDERSAEVGQVIGSKEVVELPLNGRNYF